MSLEEKIRRFLYSPSQLLLYTSCLGEKKLSTKDFWALSSRFPKTPSQLLCEICQVTLAVKWRTDLREDASWSKGCSDKIGDAGVWRGAADSCSQMGTELNIPLDASVCCSADKQGEWKTTACHNLQAQLSCNIIKELEPVLSRVWFQTAGFKQRNPSGEVANRVCKLYLIDG